MRPCHIHGMWCGCNVNQLIASGDIQEAAPSRVTSRSVASDADAAAAPFLKDSASRSAVPTPLSRPWPWLILSSFGVLEASDVSLNLLQVQASPCLRARPSPRPVHEVPCALTGHLRTGDMMPNRACAALMSRGFGHGDAEGKAQHNWAPDPKASCISGPEC